MPKIDPALNSEEECICGRLENKRHCPLCGSYGLYAIKKSTEKLDTKTGNYTVYKTFRCRACGDYSDESMFKLNCQAPKVESKRQRDRNKAERLRDTLAMGGRILPSDEPFFLSKCGMPSATFIMLLKQAGGYKRKVNNPLEQQEERERQEKLQKEIQEIDNSVKTSEGLNNNYDALLPRADDYTPVKEFTGNLTDEQLEKMGAKKVE